VCSRNCTKHKIRCPYNDVQVPDANRSTTPDKPDLMWNPEIESCIAEWKRTGIFPFPSLELFPAPAPNNYNDDELRLIHHVASLYDTLAAMGANNFTLWTRHIPTLLRIGATTPYVMNALLAFSAMHIAFLTDCPLVGSMAFVYRGSALSGLHEAINSFSRETSDAVLAASLVLSWQATDWSGWTQLMQGTSTVMEAMESWKHDSLFVDFIAESSTFPTAPSSPGPEHRSAQPRKEDLEAYQSTLEQIQQVETHMRHHNMETTQIQNLTSFLKGSRKISPQLPIAQQFERLRSLRDWLFWMPVAYLQNHYCSANSLVAIAHLYVVAILMERMFPEIGSAYFGSLSLTPIEEIARRLMSICMSEGSDDNTPLKLMNYPLEVVGEFRARMGWVQPDDAFMLPQFDSPVFPVCDDLSAYSDSESYALYGNPGFSYSTEDLQLINQPHSPHSPAVPAAYVSQPYLNIPSPMYHGAHSPASSTFEGSVAYSDSEDYKPYDMGRMHASHSPIFSEGHSFSVGFVSPIQPVWI
jgi:hypothetical protein